MISVAERDSDQFFGHLLEFLFRIIFHGKIGCLKRELIFLGIKFCSSPEIQLGGVFFSMYCMHISTPSGLLFVKLNREN